MEPLGQIAKRLEIIKTAITMTDDETINMQRSKLRLHKDNAELDKILDALDDESYVQASNLIEQYLLETMVAEGNIKEQIVAPQSAYMHTQKELDLIKKFGLFVDGSDYDNYNPISDDEMYNIAKTAATNTPPSQKENQTEAPEPKADDALLEESTTNEEEPASSISEDISQQEPEQPTEEIDTPAAKTVVEDQESESSDENVEELVEDQSSQEQEMQEPKVREIKVYEPISYIDQKLKNMRYKYPQVQESSERFESEVNFLHMISIKGYSDTDIEETISYLYLLQDEGRLAEASHLLLICASTDSHYAQFILARELYKGEIVQKNIPEAFAEINRLASDNCPEAICDLAQFYEHGIGTTRSRKKAYELYRDAKRLGVERAANHLERLDIEYKGIFTQLFGRKGKALSNL